jgi:hypothetical protein
LVDEEYSHAEAVLPAIDILTTHDNACHYVAFEPADTRRIVKRIEWHWIPEDASWLSITEIEPSASSRQCLARRILDADTLARWVMSGQRTLRIGTLAHLHGRLDEHI